MPQYTTFSSGKCQVEFTGIRSVSLTTFATDAEYWCQWCVAAVCIGGEWREGVSVRHLALKRST